MMNDVGPRTRYVTVPVVAAAIAALGGVLAAVITVVGNVAPSTPEQTLPDNVLEVLGTDGNGVQYTVPKTGVYRLTYVDGAYAQGPLDGFKGRPPWLTAVIVFAGDSPAFTGRDALNRPAPDRAESLIWAFDNGYKASEADAKRAALKAPTAEVRLEAGQTITIVCLEAEGYFGDNVGRVELELAFAGETT